MKQFLFHHCTDMDGVKAKVLLPSYRSCDEFDEYFEPAYRWMGDAAGFVPLYMAVGNNVHAHGMTGYQNQWSRWIGCKDGKNIYRKKGEFPNYIMFSFEEDQIPTLMFSDYDYWHIVLNSGHKDYNVSDYERRLVLKPSWSKSRWLRKARQNPGTVQCVVPELNLMKAGRVWVRNKKVKAQLNTMGYSGVEVKRILLSEEY
tara:strand:- start:2119 stop:2721 length:603 start_codon:yes stop_codon:yes gene_type:complete